MALVAMSELLKNAAERNYAVGYFESWDLQSLQAVIDAAEAKESPVIVGFSGIFLPDPARLLPDHLEIYAAMGLAAIRKSAIPMAFIFNESPYFEYIPRAIECGFNAVMYANEEISLDEQIEYHKKTVALAHPKGVEVEAELGTLPYGSADKHAALTDPDEAARFVEATGVDALAVSVGNVHVLASGKAMLNLEQVKKLAEKVPVPLVLHGGSGIDLASLKEAITIGIRKINVGSVMKKVYIAKLKDLLACIDTADEPHAIIGGGKQQDILMQARIAVKSVVEKMMDDFGSSGKA